MYWIIRIDVGMVIVLVFMRRIVEVVLVICYLVIGFTLDLSLFWTQHPPNPTHLKAIVSSPLYELRKKAEINR